MWSIKNENTSKETYDYDSSSRCQNLSKEKYLSSLNLKQIKKNNLIIGQQYLNIQKVTKNL